MRASYLASPPLVVAYALAGRIDLDLTSEPSVSRASRAAAPALVACLAAAAFLWPTVGDGPLNAPLD